MLILIFEADFIMFKSGDGFCKLEFTFLKFLNIDIELAYFIAVLFDFFLVEFYGWVQNVKLIFEFLLSSLSVDHFLFDVEYFVLEVVNNVLLLVL